MNKIFFSLLLVFLSGCFGPEQNYSVPDAIVMNSSSGFQLSPDSKFMSQIETVPLGEAPGGERRLRTVGQMIALANSSGDLTNQSISWVSLDSELVKGLGISMSDGARAGSAYGVTSVAASYLSDIHAGERVEIYRYGSKQNSAVGTVVAIRARSKAEENNPVVFLINAGQDWYPGTNCQVEFPLVQRVAVSFSPLSMLHEGVREFVLKETAPHQYKPEEITVVNETRDRVYALGNLAPGDRVIERGAILLKPVVHQIVKSQNSVIHVR